MIAIDAVSRLIRETAAEIILPRWKKLAPADIMEKGPGDLVTIADREAESRITAGLLALAPGTPVIGEEAVAANPKLLSGLHDLPALWFVDPVDGTQNFVRGEDRFAVMVTLMRGGKTAASWIYLPVQDRMAVAEQGAGTRLNGDVITPPAPPAEIDQISAAAHVRRMAEPLKGQVQERLKQFANNHPAFCAGFDYLALLEGQRHFLLYNRTLPWDHAPGSLLVTEAGGRAARFDGADYDPLALDSMGLLVAPDAKTWTMAQTALFT